MDRITFELRKEHPQQRCPLKDCPKEFGRVADAAVIERIQRHLIEDHSIHTTEGMVCPLCGQTYAALRLHIRRTHLQQKTPFVKWYQQLKWHIPLDDSLVYYTCRQCGRRTQNKHSMKLHVKYHLKNPTVQVWPTRRKLQPEPVDVSIDEDQDQQSNADVKAIDHNASKQDVSPNMGISDVYITNGHQKMVSVGNSVRTSTSQGGTVHNVSDIIDLDSDSDVSQSDDKKLDDFNDSDVMLNEENEISDFSFDNKYRLSENGCRASSDEGEIQEVEKEDLSQDELIEEIEQFIQEEDLAAELEQELEHIRELET